MYLQHKWLLVVLPSLFLPCPTLCANHDEDFIAARQKCNFPASPSLPHFTLPWYLAITCLYAPHMQNFLRTRGGKKVGKVQGWEVSDKGQKNLFLLHDLDVFPRFLTLSLFLSLPLSSFSSKTDLAFRGGKEGRGGRGRRKLIRRDTSFLPRSSSSQFQRERNNFPFQISLPCLPFSRGEKENWQKREGKKAGNEPLIWGSSSSSPEKRTIPFCPWRDALLLFQLLSSITSHM